MLMTGGSAIVLSPALRPEPEPFPMRHINIERAILIDGAHTVPGRLEVGRQISAETADYLVRQGCAVAVNDADVAAAPVVLDPAPVALSVTAATIDDAEPAPIGQVEPAAVGEAAPPARKKRARSTPERN